MRTRHIARMRLGLVSANYAMEWACITGGIRGEVGTMHIRCGVRT